MHEDSEAKRILLKYMNTSVHDVPGAKKSKESHADEKPTSKIKLKDILANALKSKS